MAIPASRKVGGLCLAAVISLTLAAPALGVPAGDEYVPKVPKAAGEEILRGKQGPGGTVLSPEVRGADAAKTSASGDSDSSQAGGTEDGAAGAAGTTPGAADTLFDPVVLLLIVGVGAAALSMTLRQRHSVSGDPGAESAASDLGSAPSTPDGEIVDREPRS